jgi:hypothetical protein
MGHQPILPAFPRIFLQFHHYFDPDCESLTSCSSQVDVTDIAALINHSRPVPERFRLSAEPFGTNATLGGLR